jgi:hypothetical protein
MLNIQLGMLFLAPCPTDIFPLRQMRMFRHLTPQKGRLQPELLAKQASRHHHVRLRLGACHQGYTSGTTLSTWVYVYAVPAHTTMRSLTTSSK